VHGPLFHDERPRPEPGFVMTTWWFPSVIGAGVCAYFAHRIGLVRTGGGDPTPSWPVLELVPTTGSARPVPSPDADRTLRGERHPYRAWGRS